MQTMTVREVANLLRVQPKSIYRWIERGKIPHSAIVRIGRTIRIKQEYVNRLYANETSWAGMEQVA